MKGRSPKGNPKLGYTLAVANALISGIAIYVNTLGVKSFPSAILYTALKNGVVGVLLLGLFLALGRPRQRLRGLGRRDWGWLGVVALVGGSVPYALYFTGLRMTTAVTGALGDHLQLVLVAVLAAVLLRERVTPLLWAGVAVLTAAALLGGGLGLIQWNAGTALILGATVLFAAEWVILKHLLQGRFDPITVMTAKMTLGSLILLGYVALTGGLGAIGQLTARQWAFVGTTGVILLAFTATAVLAIRHARVTAVVAIGAASPLVTIAIVLGVTHHVPLTHGVLGLLLTLGAVVAILVFGLREERRQVRREEAPA
ncbi:MAG TPA: EamA family transporter [Candidatus Dormibacteraeota bacterium]|nr:EamA family transporter [Candidatus Dormibacteraeota bacterium]